MKYRSWASLVSLMTISAMAASAPSPDGSKFARCAAMAAADERLACYDQLARSTVPAPKPAPAASSSPSAAAVSDKASAIPTNPPGSAAPSPPSATPAAAPFGLMAHAVSDPAAPSSIPAVVSRIYEDQVSNMTVLLSNGQLWAVSEAGASIRAGDAVTIKRASLGSFLLVTPDRRSYRVRRLK